MRGLASLVLPWLLATGVAAVEVARLRRGTDADALYTKVGTWGARASTLLRQRGVEALACRVHVNSFSLHVTKRKFASM